MENIYKKINKGAMFMNDKIFMSWLWYELKKAFPKQEDRQKILSAIETAKEKSALDKEAIC